MRLPLCPFTKGVIDKTKDSLARAVLKMKKYADHGKRSKKVSVGDKVF